MFSIIYVEKEIQDHPETRRIFQQHPQAVVQLIDKYSEIFNRGQQNFRIQKQRPTLILASKRRGFVLPIPEGYGIGWKSNFYFSHMYNCPFDCRYCFLQGMYHSANYVYFVNLEDFQDAMEASACYFSGYDADSLALESLTHFARKMLPFIEKKGDSLFEFRTKSVQITPFLERDPLSNCVIAYSLSPESVQKQVEARTPTLSMRLKKLRQLHERGWQYGFRFDPIIWVPDFETVYAHFFEQVFRAAPAPHSVTLGSFRMPKKVFKKMRTLYPEEPLFAQPLTENAPLVTYDFKEYDMLGFCKAAIAQYTSREKLFVYG